MLRVRITEPAERDLTELTDYFAGQQPGLDDFFLDHVLKTFSFLALHPEAGCPRQFRKATLTNLRSWRVDRFTNYLLIYQPNREEHTLEIIRVVHGARDLPNIMP